MLYIKEEIKKTQGIITNIHLVFLEMDNIVKNQTTRVAMISSILKIFFLRSKGALRLSRHTQFKIFLIGTIIPTY